MSTIQAIILGIIQGITEFLPVSSSGHLTLYQTLLGLENLDQYIAFDLVCHLGTLLAILIVFTPQIKQVISSDIKRLMQIGVGTLPLFPTVLIMKPLTRLFDQPQYLGYFFMITAVLLYLGIRFGREYPEEHLKKKRFGDAFMIGIFQTLALLPGVSRSGSTISVARILGWKPQDAVMFSFLLAIPAIIGGSSLEFLKLISGKTIYPTSTLSFMQYASGFISSFIVGYLSLLLLIRLAVKGKFMYFVWYCLIVGICSFLYFG